MKIVVKVKPGARSENVERLNESLYGVSVTEPPVEGRANQAVIAALARYFDVPKSSVTIVSGHTSRQKVIEVRK